MMCISFQPTGWEKAATATWHVIEDKDKKDQRRYLT